MIEYSRVAQPGVDSMHYIVNVDFSITMNPLTILVAQFNHGLLGTCDKHGLIKPFIESAGSVERVQNRIK